MSGIGPEIMMEQLRAGAFDQSAPRTLGSILSSSKVNVIVVAVRGSDGRMIFNPPSNTRIEAGDFLIALGDKPSLNLLERALAAD
jgi:voltage-gated potassium channel